MKIAQFLYGLAVILMPVSYAVKSLLELKVLWINPSLILTAAAFLMLIPQWGDFLEDDLRPVFLCSIAIALATIPATLSGILLRPTPFVYDAVREPLRLWLLLFWLLTSCWFLRNNPRLVFRCTAIAVFFALAAGIYMYGIIPGWFPATPVIAAYARAYFLRQLAWVGPFPVPRMSGLFVEAPPFGLFMLSSAIVLLCGWRLGERQPLLRWGIWASLLGTLLSFTDQVLTGAAIGLGVALPSVLPRRRWYFWPTLLLAIVLPVGLLWQSVTAKTQPSEGVPSVIDINGSSVGERTFHTRYGLSLLTMEGKAVLFGIGPGRYGEYATETGYYPNTVTMQFSLMEILCEWGVAGIVLLVAICLLFSRALWRTGGIVSLAFFAGLLIADGFQSNWKWEGTFLAMAVLYHSTHPRCSNSFPEEYDRLQHAEGPGALQ